jgi:hypothetical protein
MGGSLSLERRSGFSPSPQRHPDREVLPAPFQGEQRQRFLARIDDPGKHWKFSAADVQERNSCKQYMKAYEACPTATSNGAAAWCIAPADDKENTTLIVSQIILGPLEELDLRFPSTRRVDIGNRRTSQKSFVSSLGQMSKQEGRAPTI